MPAEIAPSADVLVVLATCSSSAEAETLAKTCVTEHLAACVNIVPQIRSIYMWEGALQDDAEWLLILKTTAADYPALQERLLALHSYTVPECIALSVAAGSKTYLDWVQASICSRLHISSEEQPLPGR